MRIQTAKEIVRSTHYTNAVILCRGAPAHSSKRIPRLKRKFNGVKGCDNFKENKIILFDSQKSIGQEITR